MHEAIIKQRIKEKKIILILFIIARDYLFLKNSFYWSIDCTPPRIVGIGVEVFVEGLTPARIGLTKRKWK